MKLPLDPSHFEVPLSLATCILGAAVSALGIVAATVAGWCVRLANIDPQELAIQPLLGLFISFIIVLAGFMALILRALWGKGIEKVCRLSAALNNQMQQIELHFECSAAAFFQNCIPHSTTRVLAGRRDRG